MNVRGPEDVRREMNLWLLSDWHTETRFAFDPPPPEEFDVLIVAGDVSNSIVESVEMVAVLAAGKLAIFIAGNHEWTGDGRTHAEKRAAAIPKVGMHDVSFLEGGALDLDNGNGAGVGFAGATLWEPPHPSIIGLSAAPMPCIVITAS